MEYSNDPTFFRCQAWFAQCLEKPAICHTTIDVTADRHGIQVVIFVSFPTKTPLKPPLAVNTFVYATSSRDLQALVKLRSRSADSVVTANTPQYRIMLGGALDSLRRATLYKLAGQGLTRKGATPDRRGVTPDRKIASFVFTLIGIDHNSFSIEA